MTTIYILSIQKIDSTAAPLLQNLEIFRTVVGSRNSDLEPTELVELVSKVATGELLVELEAATEAATEESPVPAQNPFSRYPAPRPANYPAPPNPLPPFPPQYPTMSSPLHFSLHTPEMNTGEYIYPKLARPDDVASYNAPEAGPLV